MESDKDIHREGHKEEEEDEIPQERDPATDMNVDTDTIMKTQAYKEDLKSFSQSFTIKRQLHEGRGHEFRLQPEQMEELAFGRTDHTRIEESSVPSIMDPRTMRNEARDTGTYCEKSHMHKKHLMFTDNTETAKFPKEELKEEVDEVEEEKELQVETNKPGIFLPSAEVRNMGHYDQTFNDNDDESSQESNMQHNSNSETEEEIIEQEEPDREIDMIIDERITPRTLAENRVNRENSFQTRAEMQSSVENLSNAMPHIQIANEYQQNHNTINERRLFNHLMGSGSIDSSDYDDDQNSRTPHGLEEQIESIKVSFLQSLMQERQKITECKKELKKYKQDFDKRKKQDWDRIHLEKEICKENKKRITKLLKDAEDIIDLDIGGTHAITTTRATLCRFSNSSLAAMFSGRHAMKYNKDRVFIDRDGEPFSQLIGYLRTGQLPTISDKKQEYLFKEEMNYWQIPFDLSEEEEKCDNQMIPSFDPQWCAPTLKLDLNQRVVKKNGANHGIIFWSNAFDEEYNYAEFKVTIIQPSRTKSHLFVGVVDKTKYRKEFLTSTFWRDSPWSYYWDVWNTKLIKTDENGAQAGVLSGYGCPCNENETKLAISYDSVERTLSFYKNGFLQGTAFRDVEKGLFPSLDIWFESGSVELLTTKKPKSKTFL